ncbi:hypothetical protein TNCV_2538971 [Trichonephila clavipes]|nr:hypothetical protein TNCV_2538971 [Trichonephila clavipes]
MPGPLGYRNPLSRFEVTMLGTNTDICICQYPKHVIYTDNIFHLENNSATLEEVGGRPELFQRNFQERKSRFPISLSFSFEAVMPVPA